MNALSFSAFIKDLASTLNKVRDDHKPNLITRQEGKPAMNVSLENFKSYEDMKKPRLLANSANAKKLHDAIAEIDTRQTLKHVLIDE